MDRRTHLTKQPYEVLRIEKKKHQLKGRCGVGASGAECALPRAERAQRESLRKPMHYRSNTAKSKSAAKLQKIIHIYKIELGFFFLGG